jgi:hypothetical protein
MFPKRLLTALGDRTARKAYIMPWRNVNNKITFHYLSTY